MRRGNQGDGGGITVRRLQQLHCASQARRVRARVKPSTISTAQLNALLRVHLRPIQRVVCPRSYPVNPVGSLILRPASRLDAFSAYPFRSWLLGTAPGGTTDTPADRPPRSSRTRGSSSQVSCAHDG